MKFPESYLKAFDQFWEDENKCSCDLMQGNYNAFIDQSLFSKLSRRDSQLILLLEDLRSRMQDESIQKLIVDLEKKKEAKAIIEQQNDPSQLSILNNEWSTNYLKDLDFNKFEERWRSHYEALTTGGGSLGCSVDEFIVVCALDLFYQHYSFYLKLNIPENNKLEEVYACKGLDLTEIDQQYNRYKLLTVDQSSTIHQTYPPKIYNKELNKFILIEHMPSMLLSLLCQLKEKHLVDSIAFRPNYNCICETNQTLLNEEVEQGKPFSFDGIGAPSVTKLYSQNYDNLWISIDQRNITFEEILYENFTWNDCVITQVVHLGYEVPQGNCPVITHIDHEYIFYTAEEFISRRNNYRQKGTFKQRYKTFKIDNSKIPFVFEGNFVLYPIIAAYFEQRELLKEYFAGVV